MTFAVVGNQAISAHRRREFAASIKQDAEEDVVEGCS
jgi:hypothetical protein